MELFRPAMNLIAVVVFGAGSRTTPTVTMSSYQESEDRRKALFMRLLRENQVVLSRVAIRLCSGDTELAEDCVQDTVLSAYKAFMSGRFQVESKFRAWILAILTNSFLMSYRKSKRAIPTADIAALVEVRQETREVVQNDEMTAELLFAMSTLSPDHRACLVLVDIEELEYADAAIALGVPIGTVRSRISRARLKMAEEILRFRSQMEVK